MRSVLISRIVAESCRWAILVVMLFACVGAACLYYAKINFAMNTDTAALISAELPWRQDEIAYKKAFPQQGDLVVAVIDGQTPELAEQAAGQLTERLRPLSKFFRSVERPDGGPFFEQNGLLYLSVEEVRKTVDDLIRAQPFLGALAADPSLHGVISSLSTAVSGVERGDAKLDELARPLSVFGQAMEKIADGKPVFFSWRSMMSEEKPSLRETRRFILIRPVLNYGALQPGDRATDVIREIAHSLNIDAEHGVIMRLTGTVPLEDEEFASLAEHAGLMLVVMMVLVIAMLWFAVRSVRMILCILATLLVGLAMTAAIGLFLFGAFNLISVAFITLFVGLGVDFGIQYSVRYRAERFDDVPRNRALIHAGGTIGHALALAAAATAAGFFAFLPTDYIGVKQLGVIAGLGMIIAFILNITLLPALILLSGPGKHQVEMGFEFLAPVDDFIMRERKRILIGAGVGVLVCLVLLPFLRFDFNPLNLRNNKTESVSTLLDLMKDADSTPNTVNTLAPSLAEARALQQRFKALPEVERTLTVESFVPTDQDQKLPLIQDAAMLLGVTLEPFEMASVSSDEKTRNLMKTTAGQLETVAASAQGEAASDAKRLAAALRKLADGPDELRWKAAQTFVPGLETLIKQLRLLMQAAPVTFDTLPAKMKADWVTADGRHRVQIVPKGDSNSNAVLARFVKAVRGIAPDVTGAPISIQEASNTIKKAFAAAGLWSFLLVTLLLIVTLRRASDVALTLAPLILAGALTLSTCVVIGQPINFANIIALPLLLGIGVAFNIYYIMAWRAGVREHAQSALTRAVFFSAMTTAAAFGSLWLSSHPGTASLGKLLLISLWWTLFCTFIVQPALLGEPPVKNDPAKRASN